MNPLNRIARTAATALILSMALTGLAAGSDAVSPSPSNPDAMKTDYLSLDDPSAKETALSGAVQLLKNTRIGKNLNRYRQRLVRRTRFEYGNAIPPENNAGSSTSPRTPGKGIRFAGGLGDNLAPSVEFDYRLKAFDFSSTFYLPNHELECDISSKPLNHFIGARTGIRLRSDGSDSEAAIQIKFRF